MHDRTENACTVSISRCPIQALEKFSKAFYGTTGSTYSALVFRPVMKIFSPEQINFSPDECTLEQ